MKYSNEIEIDELLENIVNAVNLDSCPTIYQYYTCLKNRKIIVNSPIDNTTVEAVILPLEQMDSDGTGKPIEIVINTPGGSCYVGFKLIDVIEKLKTPTTVRIYGYALSMGIFIAMAGFNNPNVKVVCNKYSIGLIHAGSVEYGIMDANAARDLADFNKKYTETIVKDFILTHSKMTEERYNEICRFEYYMTANEMLELGIVDEIEIC